MVDRHAAVHHACMASLAFGLRHTAPGLPSEGSSALHMVHFLGLRTILLFPPCILCHVGMAACSRYSYTLWRMAGADGTVFPVQSS